MTTPFMTDSIWTLSPEEAIDLDRIEAYEYALDDSRIAAEPADRRDGSRLLVYPGNSNTIGHHQFRDITDHIDAADLLIFNNTQVIPARLHVYKETGGRVELFVLEPRDAVSPSAWTAEDGDSISFECMTRSSKPIRDGALLSDPNRPEMPAVTVVSASGGRAKVRLAWPGSALGFLQQFGEVPLPPYIVRKRKNQGQPISRPGDDGRYQTVYATTPGAVAAPTAGLHFTQELLSQLDEHGVSRAEVTLTVGPGTFRPVRDDHLSEHEMHSEKYFIPDGLKTAIAECRSRGGRVIAVGTTSARALEAEALRESPFMPGWRATDIFLKPGKTFSVCDGLITNFHLPRSTLLALVACFAGYSGMRNIYESAIEKGYRFYSYGDSSLIFRP